MKLAFTLLTFVFAHQRVFQDNGNIVKEVIKAPFDTDPVKPPKRNAPAVQGNHVILC